MPVVVDVTLIGFTDAIEQSPLRHLRGLRGCNVGRRVVSICAGIYSIALSRFALLRSPLAESKRGLRTRVAANGKWA